MHKLLIATTNPGKFKEISALLADLPIQILSLKDIKMPSVFKETGNTFEENAILKAKFYQLKSGLPTLSDDAGFEINALNNEPGVNTHRWVNPYRDSTDEELINYALEKLKNIPLEKRQAQLRAALCLAIDKQHIYLAEAKVKGIIPLQISQHRMPGYPFRSMLYIPQIKKFYNDDELTESENKQYNHRRKAILKLKPIIRKLLINNRHSLEKGNLRSPLSRG